MLKTESYRKGIILSVSLNFFAKGIAFLNTLIIAYFFGANSGTDVYFYVITVTLLITSIINGIDYLVLIPETMKLRLHDGEKASQNFVNFFFFYTFP